MPINSEKDFNSLLQTDRDHVWHPFTPLQGVDDPLLVESAEGAILKTADGKEIIDAVSSWWVNLHGHSHPEIAKAVAEQAKTLEHVIFAGFTHKPAIQLAENLLSILPKKHTQIFYSDNGSTAVEVGLKMAMQYWYNKGMQKKKIIALDGAYHGDTFGAMSVGERGDFTKPFFDYLFEVEFIDFPSGTNDATVLEGFEKKLTNNDVAAFIFEPLVQGSSGMRMYPSPTLDKLLALAQKHHAISIADEVMTGFGRTGKHFACDYLFNKPDIVCLSKGLTGGTLALGATSCTEAIADAFKSEKLSKAFLHGHSYTANPIACAAANASFELLQRSGCQMAIERISAQQEAFAKKLAGKNGIKDSRSLGTIMAVEFNTDEDSSYMSEMRNQLYPYFLDRGVLLRPLGNLIYVLPPYTITNQQLQYVHNTIEGFISTLPA